MTKTDYIIVLVAMALIFFFALWYMHNIDTYMYAQYLLVK